MTDTELRLWFKSFQALGEAILCEARSREKSLEASLERYRKTLDELERVERQERSMEVGPGGT